MRIVFMGTPDFAAASLEALLASPNQILAVVTQPDRPRGRGQRLQPSPVKMVAEKRASGCCSLKASVRNLSAAA